MIFSVIRPTLTKDIATMALECRGSSTTRTCPGLVRFDLALALAHYNGTVDQLVAGLETELAEHDKERHRRHLRASVRASASWCPDPTGRHELRYWDGAGWTEWLSTQGTREQDTIT